MHLPKRNTETRSRKHCRCGEAIITECVSAALSNPACKAHAPYNTVICDLSGSTVFFPHYLMNGTIAGKKIIDHKPMF
jgi:hypothetical protein